MKKLYIEGGVPLSGSVRISGAKNSVLKILSAAMFSNEDVVLENVPHIENVTSDLEILRSLGGKAEWTGSNRLVLSGSDIDKYEIPYDLGSKYRTAALLAAPLLFKFGKAIIPKPGGCRIGFRPINRWMKTWNQLGIRVEENDKYFRLTAGNLAGTNISFKVNTHMGTDNAILSSIFIPGETTITNAAEEPEVDDLINFCNSIGADVKRTESRTIIVKGKNVFVPKEGVVTFRVQGDRNEVVTFAVGACITGGNITIKGIERGNILSFLNVLSKAGCGFEVSGDEMRIWSSNTPLSPVDVTTSPAPGFMTDWQPLITLLLTKAEGVSLLHDTVYTDRFDYIKDLNRMGAKIELLRPSDVGLQAVVSDDGYDIEKLGEPHTVAKITGPTKIKGTHLNIPDLRAGATLILAALCASGKSELGGFENVERGYENFLGKLSDLGARIS